MWTPTHVQVTVQRAKGLLYKGKNGTNDVFVTIGLGKEKYQTSVKERATDPVDWHEECELPIPKQGNKAEIVLTVLHRNFIGDEFLGLTSVPLAEFDVYEKPKNIWYTLRSKPGKEKKKYRGEIEVRIGFTVQSGGVNSSGSLSDFNKKDGLRSSFGQLSQMASSVGGSLLSLRGKDKKGLKNLAKAVGHKVSTLPGRGKKKAKEETFGTIPEQHVYSSNSSHSQIDSQKQTKGDADPGVVSDDEDEFRFDELSHKSSHSSLSVSQVTLSTPKDGSLENLGGGEFLRRNYTTPPPGKPTRNLPATERELNRWSTGPGPIDEWEAKLFGKQNKNKMPHSDERFNNSAAVNKKLITDPVVKKSDSPTLEASVDPKPPFHTVTAVTPLSKEKEPVPKPRHVQDLVKHVAKVMTMSQSMEDIPKDLKHKSEEKSKEHEKDHEKPKSSAKESFASIFNSSKQKDHDESTSQRGGTPVGITNPIRMKDNHAPETRLSREVLRKFEGKSRDDLIEMIINLQSSVYHQKQKMNDMEDYIDNLLVRVMENKPTLLQNPNGVSEGAEDPRYPMILPLPPTQHLGKNYLQY